MDQLQSMAVFVQIAEQGSLTAAAAVMGKSLPSVVRTLAALEKRLQVRLFNRTTRRIALTEEGRLYLAQCRKILADVQEAERSLTRIQSEPSGRITVTAPVRFGEMHVATSVAGFLERYPKTEVRLLLLDRMVDLLEEGVDIAVRIAHLADSSLIARPIGVIRRVVCASPALLERCGEPPHPRALADLPCIRFTGISSGTTWEFVEDEKPVTVPVQSVLTCNHVGAAVSACVSGAGFGRFLCYQVMPYLRSGELVSVLSDFEPASVPVSLVYPHNRLLSSRVRAMVDWLADALTGVLTGEELE